jgi:hypothetical protein
MKLCHPPILRSKPTLIALTLFIVHQPLKGMAEEQIFLKLSGTSDYGSGPSIMEDRYSPGGIAGIGLYIGHPNNLRRADRLLLKFDLKQILLMADKIQSVKLLFTIEYYSSEKESEEIEVGHFEESMENFEGQDLNRPDLDVLPPVKVTLDDAINGEHGARAVAPVEVDVTSAVLKDLKKGNTTSGFRLRASDVENDASQNFEPRGLVLARDEARLPYLEVSLKE